MKNKNTSLITYTPLQWYRCMSCTSRSALSLSWEFFSLLQETKCLILGVHSRLLLCYELQQKQSTCHRYWVLKRASYRLLNFQLLIILKLLPFKWRSCLWLLLSSSKGLLKGFDTMRWSEKNTFKCVISLTILCTFNPFLFRRKTSIEL